ncbi:hypothetical protein [Cohnella yongneupensis]|uniref:Ferric oxidoreductase domain-containing protein n=1 Tax=Cohnella yongneupensis TaxID=425006 RepID=A0ABW0R0R6_9BACL
MKNTKKVWIPAIAGAMVALMLLAYYYYTNSLNSGEHFRPRRPEGGALFTTMGTIALYVAAAGFSWYWFKKKLKSPSAIVRYVGRLLHKVHKWLGWATLALGATHGTYLLVTRIDDNKIYSGLASFAILLFLAGYGIYIPKIRNKWMRVVHRTLGMAWVPVLFIHAGGSVLLAAMAAVAVNGLIWLFEKQAVGATQRG